LPLFPELLPHLRQVFEQAEPGTEFVITRYRDTNQNLRTQLKRIIRRAGLEPWPKLFHNCRATRQTELAEQWPLHVVCVWLGNSRAVAAKHYLQVTEDHFERAAKLPDGALQNPVQQPTADARTDAQEARTVVQQAHAASGENRICGAVRGDATPCGGRDGRRDNFRLGAEGFEPSKANANGFTARSLWPLGHTP